MTIDRSWPPIVFDGGAALLWGVLYTKPDRIRQSDDLRLTEMSMRRRDALHHKSHRAKKKPGPRRLQMPREPGFLSQTGDEKSGLRCRSGLTDSVGLRI